MSVDPRDAIAGGDIEKVRELLDQGLEIDAEVDETDHQTMLHLAAATDKVEIAALLLDRGADVCRSDEFGDTALHKAAQNDCVKTAELLIKKGAEINAVNESGFTPLGVTPLGKLTDKESESALLLKEHGGVEYP